MFKPKVNAEPQEDDFEEEKERVLSKERIPQEEAEETEKLEINRQEIIGILKDYNQRISVLLQYLG